MLAEFLADRGDWAQVMPGARACLFSLEEGTFPLPLQLAPLHFETPVSYTHLTLPTKRIV